jgi:hypothetical protein
MPPGDGDRDGAGAASGAAVGAEMEDAPPFLDWRRIYLVVIGTLAAQVALYAALTAAYNR